MKNIANRIERSSERVTFGIIVESFIMGSTLIFAFLDDMEEN